MKWKTAFKKALAFEIVKNIWESADPPLISEAGEKYLQKQKLIKMMEQDKEAGLYDVNFNDPIEIPPSMQVVTVLKYVGMYCLGGKNGFCVAFEKKPNWFHRTMMKVCLGWTWINKEI